MDNTADKRQIGPVTTAASGGVAVSFLIAWLVEEFTGREIPSDVQAALGVVLVIIAGWLVKPQGKRVAE